VTWVKICGITNLEDALTAVDAGADALGFVFYENSPRKTEPQLAREIVEKLPDQVDKVGVFVDNDPEAIRRIVSNAKLNAVQLHGEASKELIWSDPRGAIECVGVSKIIPVIPGDSLKSGGVLLSQWAYEKIFAVLLDSQSNGTVGGTGKTFDWEATRGMVQSLSLRIPVIIAGGLTVSNVKEAVRLFQPFGVDVSSGVEARPGKKDPEKVRAFVRAVREAERNSD
jgi:phosphoribosylanthranilate isomerase